MLPEQITSLIARIFLNGDITEANFSDNALTQEQVQALAKAISQNTHLKILSLRHCEISDGQAVILAQALEKNSAIESLFLGVNQIDDEGASALAEMLKKNHTLTRLHLDFNVIGAAGASALATMLEQNNTLTVLALGMNQIGDDGATALAEALPLNDSLKTLHLLNTGIGHSGGIALITMLQHNRVLQELNISGNYEIRFTSGDVALFEKVFTENNVLKILEMHSCSTAPEIEEQLVTAIRKNNSSLTRLLLHAIPVLFDPIPDMPDYSEAAARQRRIDRQVASRFEVARRMQEADYQAAKLLALGYHFGEDSVFNKYGVSPNLLFLVAKLLKQSGGRPTPEGEASVRPPRGPG